MAESPEGSESVGVESGDDGQLTIRIPNPKVYMARQSQWKGRRGKPRCDHCRINNLKVSLAEIATDRILIKDLRPVRQSAAHVQSLPVGKRRTGV